MAVPLGVNQSLCRGYQADHRLDRIFGPGLASVSGSVHFADIAAKQSNS